MNTSTYTYTYTYAMYQFYPPQFGNVWVTVATSKEEALKYLLQRFKKDADAESAETEEKTEE